MYLKYQMTCSCLQWYCSSYVSLYIVLYITYGVKDTWVKYVYKDNVKERMHLK